MINILQNDLLSKQFIQKAFKNLHLSFMIVCNMRSKKE